MNSPKKRAAKGKNIHPIRMVRDSYTRSGFRQLSSASGFSRMIGCSDSLIRNIESGIIPVTEKLAFRIERSTGVSSQWLLDTAAKLKQGEDVSKEKILNKSGKQWMPTKDRNFQFTDQLLDVAELLCERFPAYLPPFMGVMMESFLEVAPPPSSDRHTSLAGKGNMRKYLDAYMLPFLRMVGEFEDVSREQFFKVFTTRLEERDAATSSKLLDLWNFMHSKDQYTSPSAMHPSKIPFDNEVETPTTMPSKRRSSKRGKSK